MDIDPDQAEPRLDVGLVSRVTSLAARGPRVLIGITGAPGSGKTTLARALVRAVIAADVAAVHVPMDGFHLADVELARLGRADRKGAPDTFDAWGYLALLRRLAAATDPVVYAPSFDRDLEQPVAGAIPVPAAATVVVSEGNYLLVDEQPWSDCAGLFAETWFCEVPEEIRIARLVARHREFGKSADDAIAWSTGPDQANAATVAATRCRAALVVRDGRLSEAS